MASVLEHAPTIASGIIPLRNGDVLNQPTFHQRYTAMPAGFRAELIGGVVYVPSPATNWHAVYHGDVITWLGHYRIYTPGVDLLDNGTVILDEDNEPQPDAVLRLDETAGGASYVNENGYVTGPPELHVEVAYASESIDLNQKRGEYEHAGVREYLVVLIREKAVRGFRLDGTKYTDFNPESDGVWRSRVFPGLWLNVRALLDRDGLTLLKTLQEGLDADEHRSFVTRLRPGSPPDGG